MFVIARPLPLSVSPCAVPLNLPITFDRYPAVNDVCLCVVFWGGLEPLRQVVVASQSFPSVARPSERLARSRLAGPVAERAVRGETRPATVRE